MIMMQSNEIRMLEAYIDRYGLPRVLRELSAVCTEKARELDEAQNRPDAGLWWRRSSGLDLLADKMTSTNYDGR